MPRTEHIYKNYKLKGNDFAEDIAYGNVTAAAGPDDPSEGRLF